MLTDQEKADLRKFDAAARQHAVADQCQRIHRAVHDGTIDKATIDDALERIGVITSTDAAPPKAGLAALFTPDTPDEARAKKLAADEARIAEAMAQRDKDRATA